MRFSGRLQTAASKLAALLFEEMGAEAHAVLSAIFSDQVPQCQSYYSDLLGILKPNVSRAFKVLQKLSILEEVPSPEGLYLRTKSYDFTLHFTLKAWELSIANERLGIRGVGKLRTELDYWQDSTCLLPTRDRLREFPECDSILDRPLKVPIKKSVGCSQSYHTDNSTVITPITQSYQSTSVTPCNSRVKFPPLGDNRRRIIGDQKTQDQSNLYNNINYIDKECTKNVQILPKKAKSGQASGKVLPKKVSKFSELSKSEQADLLMEDAE